MSTRKNDIRKRMQMIMGPLPTMEKDRPVSWEVLQTETLEMVTRSLIVYEDEPDSLIYAYLIRPLDAKRCLGAMLCMHQTTACGSEEPAGVSGLHNLHYALELANRGYVTLAPDLPSFGRLKNVNPLPKGYASGTMKDIVLHMRGVDLLCSLEQVNAQRVGCIGHSLGGHNALFLAAFEPRIKVAATSCGFTSWHAYTKGQYNQTGDLAAWAQDRYMPRVCDEYDNDPSKMPVTFEEILYAGWNKALYINAPVQDEGMPVEGVRTCVENLKKMQPQTEDAKNLLVEHPMCGHDFPTEQRENCYAFIDQYL